MQKLAGLAGISTRTLRYYDEIGLLPPARTSASGYRIYGPVEVDRLQQILLYRELGVTLETIREIVTDPAFDRLQALQKHREQLLNRRRQLDLIITSVENTIVVSPSSRTLVQRLKVLLATYCIKRLPLVFWIYFCYVDSGETGM